MKNKKEYKILIPGAPSAVWIELLTILIIPSSNRSRCIENLENIISLCSMISEGTKWIIFKRGG